MPRIGLSLSRDQNQTPPVITGTLNSAVRCDVTTRGLLSVTQDDGSTLIVRTDRTDGPNDETGGRTLARKAVALVYRRVSIGTVEEYIGKRSKVLIATSIDDIGPVTPK